MTDAVTAHHSRIDTEAIAVAAKAITSALFERGPFTRSGPGWRMHEGTAEAAIAALQEIGWGPPIQWETIETAPTDGTIVWGYVPAHDGSPSFQCQCAYNASAGWCAIEMRRVTHWMPLREPPS